MKTINITPDLTWIGALDPKLKVFDIIMETEFGTSYNSYLLKSNDSVAVFETVKDKFFDSYLEKIKTLVDPSRIEYIILNHTEPDHVGSVAKLLEYAPLATIVGTSAAIKQIASIINIPFKNQVVKEGSTLTVGAKTIRFISVPCLHWPDTMYSYIEEDKVLVTCDSFGAHYSNELVFRSQLDASKDAEYLSAYKYYFDMIMGPFKPFVLSALRKIKDLEIDFICPGHGMVLDKSNISYYVELYREWATPKIRPVPSIVLTYVSAYGYTEEIAKHIKKGIQSVCTPVDVLFYDLTASNINEILNEISLTKGLLIGSPTIVADTLPPVWQLLTHLNGSIHKGLKVGCFGSYGWSGEATKFIAQRFEQLKFEMPLEPLTILFKPSETDLKAAFDFGADFAAKVL